MTLRFLAGGCIVDIVDIYHYHNSIFYYYISFLIKLFAKDNTIGKVKFPITSEEMQRKGELFAATWVGNPFASKCIGALDGIAIELERPSMEYGPQVY